MTWDDLGPILSGGMRNWCMKRYTAPPFSRYSLKPGGVVKMTLIIRAKVKRSTCFRLIEDVHLDTSTCHVSLALKTPQAGPKRCLVGWSRLICSTKQWRSIVNRQPGDKDMSFSKTRFISCVVCDFRASMQTGIFRAQSRSREVCATAYPVYSSRVF